MSFYAEMLAVADSLIEEFGTTGTLSRLGATTGDDWDPTFGADSDTTITAVEVTQTAKNRPNGLGEGVAVVILAKVMTGSPPAIDDSVFWNGKDRQIVTVDPIKPGATVLAYEIGLAD